MASIAVRTGSTPYRWQTGSLSGAALEGIHGHLCTGTEQRLYAVSHAAVERTSPEGGAQPRPLARLCQTFAISSQNVFHLVGPGPAQDAREKVLAAAARPTAAESLGVTKARTTVRELLTGRADPGVRVRVRPDGDLELEQFRPVPQRLGVHRCRLSVVAGSPGTEAGASETVALHARFTRPAGRAVFGLVAGVFWTLLGIGIAVSVWSDSAANSGGIALLTTLGSLFALSGLAMLVTFLPGPAPFLPWKAADQRYVISWLENVTHAHPCDRVSDLK
jgi:hypothetical protein